MNSSKKIQCHMRRYGRLDKLPIDRPGDDVWEQLPIPFAEQG